MEAKAPYRKLTLLVKYFRKMQLTDFDIFCPITGKKGFGKSSKSISLARKFVQMYGKFCLKCKNEFFEPIKLCPKCNSETIKQLPFKLSKYLAYDNEDVKRLIHTLPPYAPLIADEAARFAMGEDWAKSENKDMKKLMAQIRTKHLVMFFNIPKFKWMDSKYRDDMATIWIRVVKRGVALIFHPDLAEVDDSWHLKELQDCLRS
ncbi:MAG: hypothetical protein R3321_13410, partial [Nitrososphaeraceae archaeon]|nr:hypothetical protein [Nitrososphaeraceae archaeon]